MSKRSRRENRRNRPRELRARDQLVVAIAAAPEQADGGITMRREMALIRSAILYADKVKVVSPSSAYLSQLVAVGQRGGTGVLRIMGEMDDESLGLLGEEQFHPETSHLLRRFVAFLESGGPVPQEFEEVLAELDAAGAEFQRLTREMVAEAGADDLLAGISAGVLEVSTAFLPRRGNPDAAFAAAIAAAARARARIQSAPGEHDLVASYVEELARLVRDRRVHLLFDEEIGDVIRAMISEGIVSPDELSIKHAGTAAVGTGILARLPTFPTTPIDELLELRNDLSAPLIRYRAATVRLSGKLTATPFEGDTADEIQDLWVSDITPALLELDELLTEHGLVREVARSFGQDVRALLMGGSAMYVGLDRLATVEEWVSAVASAAGATVPSLVKGAMRTAEQCRQAEKHELFYLYELGHLNRPDAQQPH